MDNNQFNYKQNEQLIKNKKTMLSIIGVAVLVIGLVGVTYAFFNYTRTGTSNVIRTGHIVFNSEQGTSINLSNLFPVDVSHGIPNDATKVGTVSINITGDTTYGEGIEYLVSAVNVRNTSGTGNNAKALPISIDVSITSNIENSIATTLGTLSNDYFEDRGSTTSYYSVLVDDVIENNSELVVGYIAPGATGVDGNIVIKAYLDASKIAISDTYPEGDVTHTEGEAPNQETVTDYYNGTASTWVGDRVVFTTSEWNAIQTNGVSFQVKIEANEGIWIEEPIPTIDTCPGCKFIFSTTNVYYYRGNNQSTIADIEANNDILTDDYRILNSNIFIGLKLENDTIVKAYACGIKSANPNIGKAFCIEGSNSRSLGLANAEFIEGPDLWNDPGGLLGRCRENIHGNEFYISCRGDDEVIAYSDNNGLAGVENNDYYCDAEGSGRIICG